MFSAITFIHIGIIDFGWHVGNYISNIHLLTEIFKYICIHVNTYIVLRCIQLYKGIFRSQKIQKHKNKFSPWNDPNGASWTFNQRTIASLLSLDSCWIRHSDGPEQCYSGSMGWKQVKWRQNHRLWVKTRQDPSVLTKTAGNSGCSSNQIIILMVIHTYVYI